MKYYHITALENAASIIENGLIANEDGEIFLFENKSIGKPYLIYFDGNDVKVDEGWYRATVADLIAMKQVGLKEYAMFEIDQEGIECVLIPDNVAESTADCQWIAQQPVIRPEFIDLFGMYEVKGWQGFNPQE